MLQIPRVIAIQYATKARSGMTELIKVWSGIIVVIVIFGLLK